jgi:hypothetical protein
MRITNTVSTPTAILSSGPTGTGIQQKTVLGTTTVEGTRVTSTTHPSPHSISAVYILEPTSVPFSKDSSAETTRAVTLSNEYGKSTACQDLRRVLESIGYQSIQVILIHLNNVTQVLDQCATECPLRDCVVFNLCDGCGA